MGTDATDPSKPIDVDFGWVEDGVETGDDTLVWK
jgi:hypothetical protein